MVLWTTGLLFNLKTYKKICTQTLIISLDKSYLFCSLFPFKFYYSLRRFVKFFLQKLLEKKCDSIFKENFFCSFAFVENELLLSDRVKEHSKSNEIWIQNQLLIDCWCTTWKKAEKDACHLQISLVPIFVNTL